MCMEKVTTKHRGSTTPATKEFVKKADIEQAARDAAPRSPAEAKEMLAAEQEGLRHAKDQPIPSNKLAKKPPKMAGAARK